MAYTDEQRAEAVDLYLQHGLAETHRRTHIPRATLRDWLKKAGHDPADTAAHTVEQTRAAVEKHTAVMAEARVSLQAAFATSALFAAGKVPNASNGRDAQGWATASAILTDKLRLELGEATVRTEIVTPDRNPEHDEEIATLYDMAEHRVA